MVVGGSGRPGIPELQRAERDAGKRCLSWLVRDFRYRVYLLELSRE